MLAESKESNNQRNQNELNILINLYMQGIFYSKVGLIEYFVLNIADTPLWDFFS